MSLNTIIKDGTGSKYFAKVEDSGALRVILLHEPVLAEQKIKVFRQYLTTTGLSSGSNDMGVDGSSTNVDFYIPSDSTDDRYITSLSIIVGYGASGQPNLWADGTALTNGTRLYYVSKFGEIDIHDAIKTNQDMFRLKQENIDTNWEVRHVNATNDYGYFIFIDLRVFVPPYGVKLDRGTTQKLVMKVRDNAGLAADSFNCIAYGFDRFE